MLRKIEGFYILLNYLKNAIGFEGKDFLTLFIRMNKTYFYDVGSLVHETNQKIISNSTKKAIKFQARKKKAILYI